MEFVVLWIICGVVASVIASSKGGNGLLGFIVGVLLGPFGIIIAFFMGDQAKKEEATVQQGAAKKCPRCAELVKRDALVCKHCGHEFGAATSEASLRALQNPAYRPADAFSINGGSSAACRS